MTAIGGRRCERLPAQRDQVVLVHKSLNSLGINQQAGSPEEGGDPPVAVETMRQAKRLDQGNRPLKTAVAETCGRGRVG